MRSILHVHQLNPSVDWAIFLSNEKNDFCMYLNVSHAVIVKVGRGGEAFAAHGALVRLLSAVDAPVRVK